AQNGGKISKLNATTGTLQYELSPISMETLSSDPATGHLYATTRTNPGEIKEFNVSGPTPVEVSSTPLSSFGRGVGVNWATGNLYAAREGNTKVEVFAPGPGGFELTVNLTGTGGGEVKCKFNGGAAESC